jgi:hypothetical protein
MRTMDLADGAAQFFVVCSYAPFPTPSWSEL